MNDKTQHTKYQIPNTKPKKRRKVWILPLPIAIALIISFVIGGGALIYALTKTTEKAGPVGYWKFDEGEGTVAYNASGDNNNGTLTNFDFNASSSWTTGKVAGALKFDGSNDYVNCGTSTSLDLNATNGLTIEFWIKSSNPNAGTWRGIVDRGNLASYSVRWRDTNAMSLSVLSGGIGRDIVITTKTSWTANQWYHIAFTYISGDAKVYVDGVQDTSAAPAYSIDSTATNLDIGRAGSNYFNGLIDEVRIYNRALSADEVRWNYNRGGPIGWWKFDEGSGSTAYDSSGNGNNGIIYGASSTAGKINSALSFDGTNDYVDAGNSSTLRFGTGDFTMSIWFKPTSVSSYYMLIGKDSESGRDWTFWIGATANKLGFTAFIPAVNVISTGNVIANQWNHGVVTRQSGTVTLYIDGQQNGSNTITNNFNLTNSINIGRREYSGDEGFFPGLIDDVRIYNYARSASEIRTDYNAGFAVKFGGSYDLSRGLVGYWDFDEGAGTVAYDGSTNGNNGILTNFDFNASSSWTTGKVAGALKFDGSNDYVNCGSSTVFNITSEITIEAWLYSESYPQQHNGIVTKTDVFELNLKNDNTFDWWIKTTGWQNCTTTGVSLNQWTHYVATYDGSNMKKNGKVV